VISKNQAAIGRLRLGANQHAEGKQIRSPSLPLATGVKDEPATTEPQGTDVARRSCGADQKRPQLGAGG
jgi:hypothetical protein